MVILDTDHFSLLEYSDSEGAQWLLRRLDSLLESDVATTIISYEEQMRGWLALTARCRTLASQVEVYRRTRAQLESYCGIPSRRWTCESPRSRWPMMPSC